MFEYAEELRRSALDSRRKNASEVPACEREQRAFLERYQSLDAVLDGDALHTDVRRRKNAHLVSCAERKLVQREDEVCDAAGDALVPWWGKVCENRVRASHADRTTVRAGILTLGRSSDVLFIAEFLRADNLGYDDYVYAFQVRHPDRREPLLVALDEQYKTEADGLGAVAAAYGKAFTYIMGASAHERSSQRNAYAFDALCRATACFNRDARSGDERRIRTSMRALKDAMRKRNRKLAYPRVAVYAGGRSAPDGARFAVDDERTLTVYDVATGEKLALRGVTMDDLREHAAERDEFIQELCVKELEAAGLPHSSHYLVYMENVKGKEEQFKAPTQAFNWFETPRRRRWAL